MNVVYERIDGLCKENGTNYNAVCLTLGIKPARIGNLKSREKSVPKTDVVLALSQYFNVSPEYILGKTDERGTALESKKIPATESDEDKDDFVITDREKRILELFRSQPEEKIQAVLSLLDISQDDL